MTTRTSRRPHAGGFTLIEMMVGLTVSAIIIAGSITLMVNQQQAYQNSANDRAGQESARLALNAMGDALRRAGYGIHPAATFDFGTIRTVTFDSVSGVPVQFLGRDCPTDVACRDNADALSGSDQIAFHARDPYFVRALFAPPTATQIVVAGTLSSPLLKGQLLAVACGGACGKRWAYVMVDRTTSGTSGGAAITNIFLQTGGTGLDFPYQNSALTDTCYGSHLWDGVLDAATGLPVNQNAFALSSKVFKVDRYRFYVARFLDPDNNQQRPYLMLNQGLSDDQGPITVPVAADIEAVQFTYIFPNAPVVANQIIGGTPPTAIANGPTGIDLTVSPPLLADTRNSLARQSQSPANIRAVKMSVVVRSPETDITLPSKALTSTYLPAAGNRAEIPSVPTSPTTFPDPYHWRALFEETVELANMDARALFCGDYSNGVQAGLNLGGG
jgi:type IV pilus assembly protein PilW